MLGGDQDLNLGLNAMFYFLVDHLLHGIHILTKKQTGKDGLLHLQPVLKRTPKQALHFMTFSFFSQGVGVCPLPERDGQNGSGHPRHVPGKGHPGSLPERGVSLHWGAAQRSRAGQGTVLHGKGHSCQYWWDGDGYFFAARYKVCWIIQVTVI